jgi:hypothetical protein
MFRILFVWIHLVVIATVVTSWVIGIVHGFSPLNIPNDPNHHYPPSSSSSSSSSSFSASGGREVNNNNSNNSNNNNNSNPLNDMMKSSKKSSVPPSLTPPTILEYNDFLPSPNTVFTAENVVFACMDTLMQDQVQGLEVCYAFSSDRCRAAIGGSLDRFQEYAKNPIFSYLIHCSEWNILRMGPIIPGTNHRGAMQTCLMSVRSSTESSSLLSSSPSSSSLFTFPPSLSSSPNDDENTTPTSPLTYSDHRFLWTLQQERRPPYESCWMIHEVLFVKNAYQQTL